MKTILVVDDEPVIRSLAELSLDDSAWQVKSAPDAGAALRSIQESKPDLIFLDLGLPDVSGRDLARRLRSEAGTADIRIVYMTGAAPEECAEADDVMCKPFTPDVLRAQAARWLR
jgi:two-component system phosphate regulon response regulator PhoB